MTDYEKFLKLALNFLSYQPRTEKETRDKLTLKNAPPEIIDQIITSLKQNNFLNDTDYAAQWIRTRQNFRIKSQKAIKIELLKKGIDPQTIDQALSGELNEEEGSGINDKDQALKLIQKRLPRYQHLPKQELYQKLGSYLARRGFNWETIKTTIDACYSSQEKENPSKE